MRGSNARFSRLVFSLLLPLFLVPASADAASLTPWQLTTPLPVALAAHAMTATTTHVYVLGGVSGTNCTLVDSVNVAPILPDGSLGTWTATTPLTFPRGFLGAAVVGGISTSSGGPMDAAWWRQRNTPRWSGPRSFLMGPSARGCRWRP